LVWLIAGAEASASPSARVIMIAYRIGSLNFQKMESPGFQGNIYPGIQHLFPFSLVNLSSEEVQAFFGRDQGIETLGVLADIDLNIT
jgi:hypothetical protein